jgi:hypothetical protein
MAAAVETVAVMVVVETAVAVDTVIVTTAVVITDINLLQPITHPSPALAGLFYLRIFILLKNSIPLCPSVFQRKNELFMPCARFIR